jgi:DNA polymerase I-like protein with 3'-5' exonuclease and polymerase domains
MSNWYQMQNLTDDRPLGRGQVKSCFVSRYANGVVMEIDAKQLEVNALAEVTNDEELMRELNSGVDIHAANAQRWLGRQNITDKERKNAKSMTFQLQYGARPKGIARKLGIEQSEAERFLDGFLKKYEGVALYFRELETWTKVLEKPCKPNDDEMYAMVPWPTPTGRQYHVKYVEHPFRDNLWYLPDTCAKNYPIQGFATGDLMPFICNRIIAMCEDLIEERSVSFATLVHDSVVLDVREPFIADVFKRVEEVFSNLKNDFFTAYQYSLKLRYDYSISVGRDWLNSVEYDRKQVQETVGANFSE